MNNSNKIINFPKKIDIKKKKYAVIRDEVESLLYRYACDEKDLWAVAMAANGLPGFQAAIISISGSSNTSRAVLNRVIVSGSPPLSG